MSNPREKEIASPPLPRVFVNLADYRTTTPPSQIHFRTGRLAVLFEIMLYFSLSLAVDRTLTSSLGDAREVSWS